MTGGPAITLCQIQGAPAARAGTTTTSSCSPRKIDHWALACVGDGAGKPTVHDDPRPGAARGRPFYPSMLPGGRGVLFTITAGQPRTRKWPSSTSRRPAQDLDSWRQRREVRRRLDHPSTIGKRKRSQGSYLVYVSAGTLRGVGFDLAKLEVLANRCRSSTTCWSADPVRPTMPSRSRARSSMHR